MNSGLGVSNLRIKIEKSSSVHSMRWPALSRFLSKRQSVEWDGYAGIRSRSPSAPITDFHTRGGRILLTEKKVNQAGVQELQNFGWADIRFAIQMSS